MKHLKTFESYLDSPENQGLYDEMSKLLSQAGELCDCEISDPDSAIEALEELGTNEAINLSEEISALLNQIYEAESEAFFNEEDEE